MCGGRIGSRVCVVGGSGVECVWWEDREESVCGGRIGSSVCVGRIGSRGCNVDLSCIIDNHH